MLAVPNLNFKEFVSSHYSSILSALLGPSESSLQLGGGGVPCLKVWGRTIGGTFFLKSAELSVSVFEICAELWVPFWENIAKSRGGRFSINKLLSSYK